MELYSGVRCGIFNGSTDVILERPIRYQCEDEKTVILEGNFRTVRGLTYVDVARKMETQYDDVLSEPVKTFWYGRSGRPFDPSLKGSGRLGTQQALTQLLDSWVEGDDVAQGDPEGWLGALGEPTAVSSYTLAWSPDCEIDNDRFGYCGVSISGPNGESTSYLINYFTDFQDQLTLTGSIEIPTN